MSFRPALMVLPVFKTWLRVALSPRYLLWTNILCGTGVLTAGDFVHQHAVLLREKKPLQTDWRRTLSIVAVSIAFFSPLNHFYYKWLDSYVIRGTRGVIVSKKLAIDTVTGPFFASSYVVGINITEGNSISDGFIEYYRKFAHFLALDAFLWIPVQAVNFWFLPPSARVLFVSTASMIDSFFFAHIKQDDSIGRESNEGTVH